jgi:hypothetical protein
MCLPTESGIIIPDIRSSATWQSDWQLEENTLTAVARLPGRLTDRCKRILPGKPIDTWKVQAAVGGEPYLASWPATVADVVPSHTPGKLFLHLKHGRRNFKDTNPLCRLHWSFCLGWWSNLVGSASGQKQSVKFRHTLSVYIVHLVWEGGKGGEVREKIEGQQDTSTGCGR